MRILSKRTLREFWESYPDCEQQLVSWYKDFSTTSYTSTNDLIDKFSNCQSLGLNRYVFNIKGNNYRLIVKINFELHTIWIRFIGTHAEYNKIDALNI